MSVEVATFIATHMVNKKDKDEWIGYVYNDA